MCGFLPACVPAALRALNVAIHVTYVCRQLTVHPACVATTMLNFFYYVLIL